MCEDDPVLLGKLMSRESIAYGRRGETGEDISIPVLETLQQSLLGLYFLSAAAVRAGSRRRKMSATIIRFD
jgi:hypothetical protein